MSADVDRFVREASAAIERGHFRSDPVQRVRLGSAEWALSHLEPWEYRAIATFLNDMVGRPPFNGSSFAGHRMVLSALASDLTTAANEEERRAV